MRSGYGLVEQLKFDLYDVVLHQEDKYLYVDINGEKRPDNIITISYERR